MLCYVLNEYSAPSPGGAAMNVFFSMRKDTKDKSESHHILEIFLPRVNIVNTLSVAMPP
jgi:hypothetical protein